MGGADSAGAFPGASANPGADAIPGPGAVAIPGPGVIPRALRGLGLDGSVVLVTGGVRGVGAGITRAFLRAGATVVTCARHRPQEPVAVDGQTAEFAACDVRAPDQVERLVRAVAGRHGRLDVVVNNAGGSPYALAAQASPRLAAKVVELNLLAPLLVSQQAHAIMAGQTGGGAIVMVSSVSGRRPSPGTAAYGAAKAGLDSLAASLAVEWAPMIRVNALAVGMVRTENAHLHYGDAEGAAAVARTVPLGRLAEPDEIGACAAFLASPLASYVTGATLTVHGGGEVPAFLGAAGAGTTGAADAAKHTAAGAANQVSGEQGGEHAGHHRP